MTLDGETRIFSRHAGAVVADFDEFLAAGFEDDVDGPSPGVDRVFDQLLDDRGRPLHDLARRNLVDQLRGKDADGGHWGHFTGVAGGRLPVASGRRRTIATLATGYWLLATSPLAGYLLRSPAWHGASGRSSGW